MSNIQVGVFGHSPGSTGTGVLGDASGTGGVAVAGFATGSNGIGVQGQALAPGAKAGMFNGQVEITRTLEGVQIGRRLDFEVFKQ